MQILKVFEKKLRNMNYSDNTIKIYKHFVLQFLNEISYNDPYQIPLKSVVNFIENKIFTSITQQNQYISSLKLFSKYILKRKLLHINKIERPRKNKSLPKIIDKEFLIYKISTINNLKHKTIISLTFSTGIRVSEVCNLKITDIDSKKMVIYIKNSKNNKDRIVPLSENILNMLRKYYILYKPNEYLFNGQKSLKYSHSSCNKIVKKYIGDKYHFHQLRHSNATTLLEEGTDLRIIQKL